MKNRKDLNQVVEALFYVAAVYFDRLLAAGIGLQGMVQPYGDAHGVQKIPFINLSFG